jgi:hypothetical protein
MKRPDLSPRDRSIVTLAALIARNQTVQMPYYLNLALDNGVRPSEISEIISISLSTQAGRMLYRRSSLPKKYSGNAGLVPINFRRHQLNCSLSMRPQRNSAQAASSRTLGRSLQALSSTPPTSSSVISGCVLDWCRETAAWSVLSSPQDRLRKSPITS